MKIGILWDLDGTLLDTLADLRDGVNAALEQLGLPPRRLEEIRAFVGNGARNLMTKALEGRADVDVALKAFHDYYDVHCNDKTGPYPGIPEALAVLGERYPMAIVTNKPHSAAKPLCDRYFPGIYARGEMAGTFADLLFIKNIGNNLIWSGLACSTLGYKFHFSSLHSVESASN